MSQTRIAILVGPKSSGSNMASLAAACRSGDVTAIVGVVIAPIDDCPAAIRAREMELPVVSLSPASKSYAKDLLGALLAAGCRFVCLAGYLRLLPLEVLEAYPRRVLNIHPALLPHHGGKGMYGQRVHQAVLEAGDVKSGCTVHYVTEQYDEGQPLLQLECPVFPEDTPETLAKRVLALEHKAYPMGLQIAIDHDERTDSET